jgi:hypothetical protein
MKRACAIMLQLLHFKASSQTHWSSMGSFQNNAYAELPACQLPEHAKAWHPKYMHGQSIHQQLFIFPRQAVKDLSMVCMSHCLPHRQLPSARKCARHQMDGGRCSGVGSGAITGDTGVAGPREADGPLL